MHGVGVRRLKVDCAVPRNHPDPLAVRARVDEATGRLPAALGELLAPLARAGDEVIVIRRLELTFDLDTSLEPADLARAWAARLAAAVASALRPEARVSMLRFPDEAHYLARFLADSVAERATGSWFYRRWCGLDALPLAAQLRTAIVEQPACGIAALAALSRSEASAVLAALGPSEARRVVEAVIAAESECSAGGEAAARVLATAVPDWISLARALPSAWQAALALVACVHAALQPGELRPALMIAAALAAVCQRERAAGAATTAAIPIAELPAVEPLLALTADVRRALLEAAGTAEPTPAETAPRAGWYTRLGGLLLLLPRLAELSIDGCTRLALLSRAAGHARRAEVLSDPLWRHLCGVEPEADVEAWLERPEVEARLSSELWRRGAAWAERLRVIVTRHEQPLAIVASEPDGDWLAVAPLTPVLRAVLRGSSEWDGVAPQITHASARAAAQTLAWLGANALSPLERALAAGAQQVMRAFARRLPGFSGSSLPFLYDHFLDFDATVLESEGTFHCRIGRPRLAAVFGLTGALRGRLPIGDGRGLELYPEG